MNRSFTNFLRRNLAAARLAVLSQLEYRINFLIDAVLQPVISSAIEVTLWAAILSGMGTHQLGGYGREYYLAYALWATFVGRVTINWMYEFLMLDEIDSGRVNAILMRPISFYEFYLSQFVGYKLFTAGVGLFLPFVICLTMGLPLEISRIPWMLVSIFYYLVFVHTLSFTVACCAFFLNRAHSFTGIKNMAIWVLAGELIPLDLYPEPFRTWLIHSPFASGVYIPVGYVTGRIGHELFMQSFLSITAGTVVAGGMGVWLWRRGLRAYTGTGA
ncbi:MAG: ABC transporter permease [Bdellovibrionales bacterium]|nr:ABC transporter permease [Bdellovibrionales bacterium]